MTRPHSADHERCVLTLTLALSYNAAMSDRSLSLTMDDLVARSGVPARTIRYYISEGLLAGPGARGKSAAYGEDQLLRLLMIRRLADRRVPLVEIRDMLSSLSPDQMRSLLAEEEQYSQRRQQAIQTQSPRAYIASLLEEARGQSVPGASQPERTPQTFTARFRPATSPDVTATSDWQRIELAPGLELHVRTDRAPALDSLVRRIVDTVRETRIRDH